MDDLLRLEDLGQAVQALVGHLDDADVKLEPAEPAGSAWPRVSVLKTVVLPDPASPTMAICMGDAYRSEAVEAPRPVSVTTT